MAEFPAFPLWTDAYIGDTTHLKPFEHGVYLLLLIAMWRTRDGTLPDDRAMLSRFARCTPGEWKRAEPIIMPFFDKIDGGKITQSRLQDELQRVRDFSESQRQKSNTKWLKTKKPRHARAYPPGDAQPMPNVSPADATLPTSHELGKKEEIPFIAPTLELTGGETPFDLRRVNGKSTQDECEAAFKIWYAAYPNKVAPAKARQAFRSAVKKTTAQELVDGLQRYIRDKPSDIRFCGPAVWLNGERWLDRPAPIAAMQTTEQALAKTAERMAALDAERLKRYQQEHPECLAQEVLPPLKLVASSTGS